MKKTVIFKTNSDDKIIIGFGDAQVDPVATLPKVKIELKKTQVFKDINEKKNATAVLNASYQKYWFDSQNVFFACSNRLKMDPREMDQLKYLDIEAAKKLFNKKEVALYDAANAHMKSKESEGHAVMEEIIALNLELKKEHGRLIDLHSQYFTPHLGEEIIEMDEFESLAGKVKDLKKGEFLKRDGSVGKVG